MKTINNDIKETRVGFPNAKLLKEKGFCVLPENTKKTDYVLGYVYDKDDEDDDILKVTDFQWEDNVQSHKFLRPTQQVAIDWILENFEIHITITSISQESWQFHITKIGGVLGAYYEEDFNSPEEAKETAINYVLINLL